jgi:(R,R)-butanediol dehydrogenase/meso-butanediol dehydrogenase/diacetyl reductase
MKDRADRMWALRFHAARDLRLENIARPGAPLDTQVKIRVGAAGICGSDLHVYETAAYVTKFPVTMGHEFAGEVLEIGGKVEGLTPGDHVTGDSKVSCGRCASCERGFPNLCFNLGFVGEVCDGAFSEELLIDGSSLVPISRDVPSMYAALAEPLAVAIHASRILILGAGPIGALIQTVLTLKGFENVQVTDISDYRRGAVASVYPESVVARPEGSYDVVFETTGAEAVVRQVLPECTAKGGRLVMVGLFRKPVPFDFNLVVENEWVVRGCSAFSVELPEAVRTLEQHWERFKNVISHEMPLADYEEAFELLLSPEKKAVKIIFTPSP